jgi:hypothetical protein
MREKRAESFNRLGWTCLREGQLLSQEQETEEKKSVPSQISDQVMQRIH